MDVSIWGEYALVFLVLVVLEGILSADNAVVMAVIVKGLPHDKQRKALFYGLVGAFVFRFVALFFNFIFSKNMGNTSNRRGLFIVLSN